MCFAGKHENRVMTHEAPLRQATWGAYYIARQQSPKSLYGIHPPATPGTLGMEKSLSLYLEMGEHFSGEFSAHFYFCKSPQNQSESGQFNKSDFVFFQVSASTIQMKINGMKCEGAQSGEFSFLTVYIMC